MLVNIIKDEPWNFKLIKNVNFHKSTKKYDGMTPSANYLEKVLYLVLIKERELNIKRCLLSFDFLERNTNKNRKTLFSEVVKLIEDLLFRLNQLNDTNLNTPPIIFSSVSFLTS